MTKNVDCMRQNPVYADNLEENALLTRYFSVICGNAGKILNTPEYFFCQPDSAYLDLFYIGGGMVPLGALLQLWQEGKLKGVCPECGKYVYIIGAGGSPLSGSHSWWGVCPSCQKFIVSQRAPDFSPLWHLLYDKVKEYDGWENGPRQDVDAKPLKALIEELKSCGAD